MPPCLLCCKSELLGAFKPWIDQPKGNKADWLEPLAAQFSEPRSFAQWCPDVDDVLYSLTVMELCDRLRLMFFGNLHQDWSEFVLADLGIYTYEKSSSAPSLAVYAAATTCMGFYSCTSASKPLKPVRHWIRCWRRSPRCAPTTLAGKASRQAVVPDRPVLRTLRRAGTGRTDLPQLHSSRCAGAADPRTGAPGGLCPSHGLGERGATGPHNAAEQQHLLRVLPRLRRKLGGPALPRAKPQAVARLDLALVQEPLLSVESCVLAHLSEPDAPVHYVENGLINSLFGLLCWEAIFAPLPGAFFHPFQRGPADLHSEDFYQRREALFAACFAQLEDGRYKASIRQRYVDKWGIQSPFVFWNLLSEELLEQALACLPAEHLRHWFTRLLQDIRANRAGMPDLIQFWPAQNTYRMIEVRAPATACRTTSCAGWRSAVNTRCRSPFATCAGRSNPLELQRGRAGAV